MKLLISLISGCAFVGALPSLALDHTLARMLMVIMVAGGRFGLGGRFMALPWGLVQPVADETALVVALAPEPPHCPPNEKGLEATSPNTRRP